MPLRDQRVLVTGGAGLVGAHLIARLLSEDVKVRATLHRKTPKVRDPRVEYLPCDLTRAEDCEKAAAGVRYVFHCAAISSGAASTAAAPMVQVTPNLLMNAGMLAAAHAARVEKFLWLGSTTAYPSTGNRPVKEEEIFTGEPDEKYFFVGWEKRMMEILCRMYGEKLPEPMTTIVLRPTNIYGPNDEFDPARSRVVAALIRKVVERQNPIEVWGGGDDIRDHIFVDDVVEAMMIAIEKIESYATFNIGAGRGRSVKELLKLILQIDGYENAQIVFNVEKPSMIPLRLVDVTKAETQLGFAARTELSEGLKKTIRWRRQTVDLPLFSARP